MLNYKMGVNKTFVVLLLVLSLFLVSGQAGCPARTDVPEVKSPEEVLGTEEPGIELISAPQVAEFGQRTVFTWRVAGPSGTVIPHTAIHYDEDSNPAKFALTVAPDQSGYRELTLEFASGEFEIPREFSTHVTFDEVGTFYYRAHAIVNGQHYWTDERSIEVKTFIEPQPRKTLNIDADDNGFYINNEEVERINVDSGDLVDITFNVRTQDVYYGGLDFRGCKESTAPAKPGESVKFEFSAEENCTITSYWPSSGVKKADLEVIVA